MSNSDWRNFQDEVARLFNQTPGWVACVNHLVRGSRACVRVDVWAEFDTVRDPNDKTGPFHGRVGRCLVHKVIVECKSWKRRIPQEKIMALKAIVEDVGASEGILVSKFGAQEGATKYANNPVNVEALTFTELQSRLTRGSMATKPLAVSSRFGPRSMANATCTGCGFKIKVPFPLVSGKSVYCRACYGHKSMKYPGEALVGSVGFNLLGDDLGSDIKLSLKTALLGGAVFFNVDKPLSIFRQSLSASIRDIESHPRGRLFQDFLLKGPYEAKGAIPSELLDQRLSDEDTTAVIAFIYSHMVQCFKGALAEMLATAPCLHIVRELQAEKRLPRNARLYVGDAVWAWSPEGTGFVKGADLHILTERRSPKTSPSVAIGGVAEVKSFSCRPELLRLQVDRHIVRAQGGLRVGSTVYSSNQISVGDEGNGQVARITVLPSNWRLPRKFHFELNKGRKFLHLQRRVPPHAADFVERVSSKEWRIILRWSNEALDAAAYEMTFWYMEKVGEVLYSHGVPKEWAKMTPAGAGQNAAKMMLYYAILRCRTARESQRAIALYNSYSFGPALGLNFRNAKGQREMLWPQDLDEILMNGKTKHGCRIV